MKTSKYILLVALVAAFSCNTHLFGGLRDEYKKKIKAVKEEYYKKATLYKGTITEIIKEGPFAGRYKVRIDGAKTEIVCYIASTFYVPRKLMESLKLESMKKLSKKQLNNTFRVGSKVGLKISLNDVKQGRITNISKHPKVTKGSR